MSEADYAGLITAAHHAHLPVGRRRHRRRQRARLAPAVAGVAGDGQGLGVQVDGLPVVTQA